MVPSESNGGFNAKWDREGGIEKKKTECRNINDFIINGFVLLQFNKLDFVEKLAEPETHFGI